MSSARDAISVSEAVKQALHANRNTGGDVDALKREIDAALLDKSIYKERWSMTKNVVFDPTRNITLIPPGFPCNDAPKTGTKTPAPDTWYDDTMDMLYELEKKNNIGL